MVPLKALIKCSIISVLYSVTTVSGKILPLFCLIHFCDLLVVGVTWRLTQVSLVVRHLLPLHGAVVRHHEGTLPCQTRYKNQHIATYNSRYNAFHIVGYLQTCRLRFFKTAQRKFPSTRSPLGRQYTLSNDDQSRLHICKVWGSYQSEYFCG
jgi:hypothetical protein